MRNRVSCSAQELNQLDPDMLQSVVGNTIFEMGKHYFSDQRVKILEADKAQISAEVNGAYGVYTQTIKLRAGTLSTRCSCPSTEQPFCRHCVAVLLYQFHHGSTLKLNTKSATSQSAPSHVQEPSRRAADSFFWESKGAVDLNFWEAILFIDWIQKSVGLLGKEALLPPVPDSLRGIAREWVGVIDRINSQYLEMEEDRNDLQKHLRSAEVMIEILNKKVETLQDEDRITRQK